MTVYKTPGAYIERIDTQVENIIPVGTSVAGFIGECEFGPVNTPYAIYSWDEYKERHAPFLTDPFAGGWLGYAVYTFFKDGGGVCYVNRIIKTEGTKAAVTSGRKFEAKYGGTWANSSGDDVGLEVDVIDNTTSWTIKIYMNGTLVEEYALIAAADINDTISAASKYVNVTLSATPVAGTGLNLVGGTADGTATITEFETGMTDFDSIDGVNLLAVPGQAQAIQNAMIDYCAGRLDCIAICDVDEAADTYAEMIALAGGYVGSYGAVYGPWGNLIDPVSGLTVAVPVSGAVCGYIAVNDSNYGVSKAPAGVEAKLTSFTSMVTRLSDTQIGELNYGKINCIVNKRGRGNIIWGAKLANADADRVYVSDLRLDMFIEESIQEAADWAVFQKNGQATWSLLKTQITSFLESQRLAGNLKGETQAEAFIVRCDSTLNTPAVIDAGQLICEVGWAKYKPSEFIIIRVSAKQ